MSSVSLSMIVKDEYTEVAQLVSDAINYVDEIVLVVSDKRTANDLRAVATPFKQVKVKYRKWTDRFDEARNVALKMCTSDYMFWIDADDRFDFSALSQLVEMADENGIDAIFLPYYYMFDAQGNLAAKHWRERLVRLNRGYEWRGWVHETLISEENPKTHMVDLPVIHTATADSIPESLERNHSILLKAYDETEDPRYLHYLAMSFFSKREFETTIKLFQKYLEVGKSIDDIFRALATISESYYHLGQYEGASEYALRCIGMKPEYPMGYWLMAQYESDQDNHKEALEWVRTSQSKPDPDTLAVWDPTSRTRATFIAAKSLFMLERYTEAFEELKKIRESEEAKTVWEDFLHEAEVEKFLTVLPTIKQFFWGDMGLWNGLSDEIKYDPRIRSFRYSCMSPTTWDDKSIVIFCGQGYEEWGPHTLNKGMGGSEEAVVYLSRELSRLGYHVTVYGEVEKLFKDQHWDDPDGSMSYNVYYLPWREIDTRDNFNVFISWRAPQYIEKINAKVKLVDVHDVLPEEMMKDYPDVTYLVKTAYHRSLTPSLPDEKFEVIGNGIAKDQFDGSDQTEA